MQLYQVQVLVVLPGTEDYCRQSVLGGAGGGWTGWFVIGCRQGTTGRVPGVISTILVPGPGTGVHLELFRFFQNDRLLVLYSE
jgi:hypothetical protein